MFPQESSNLHSINLIKKIKIKNNNKTKLKKYSIGGYQNVLQYANNNPNVTQENLKNKFGMSIGVINDILKNKSKYEKI